MKAKSITNANIRNGEENFHLGGYIQKIWYKPATNDKEGFLTIGMKSFDSYGSEYINIMVFERKGKGDNKYPNPDYQLCIDAYEKGVPISCVFLHTPKSNTMKSMYVNFSANQFECPEECAVSEVADFTEIDEDGDLPF